MKSTLGACLLAFGVVASLDGALAESPPYRLLRIGGQLVRWAAPAAVARATPITLTYALLDRELSRPGAVNCKAMAPAGSISGQSDIGRHDIAVAARRAFDRWQDVAPFVFVPVATAEAADIVIGTLQRSEGIAFADLELGATIEPGVRGIQRGAMCLNPVLTWTVSSTQSASDGEGTFDLVDVLSHEIGHVLGLDHPNGRGHLMSFRYQHGLSGLTAGDIAGIRALYAPLVASISRTQ